MIKHDIGINAGTIWHLLKESGELSLREIGELTGYKDSILLLALGWLARENKVHFINQDEMFKIRLNDTFAEMYY